MPAQREVQAHSRQQLIGPIQQYCSLRAHLICLRIAIEYVAQVGCHIYVLTQPPVYKSDHPKVSKIASRPRPTPQLIEVPRTVPLLLIPPPPPTQPPPP